MEPNTSYSVARRHYDIAHAMHYQSKDLARAVKLYKEVMVAYPDSLEAGYSRSQILNIVNSVVPQGELFDAQVELVQAIFMDRNRLN